MNIITKGLEIADLLNANHDLAQEVGNYIETPAALKLVEKTVLYCSFEEQVTAVAKGLADAACDGGNYKKYLDQASYLLES
jgi:hypothetical protein